MDKKVGIIMSQVGERIRHMRVKCGIINQEELARRIGTTRQTVSLWERGIFLPDAANLSKLVKTLGTSSAYLMGETDSPEPIARLSEDKAQAESRVFSSGICYRLTAEKSGRQIVSFSKQNGGKTISYELTPEQAVTVMPFIEALWNKIADVAEGTSNQ
jgi:transcriptional regulator with XRE-family HTH domain